MSSTLSVAKFGGPKSGKFRKMLAAYAENQCSDLTKACADAGYGFPSKAAGQVRKRWADVIAAVEVEWRSGLSMDAEEATERMAAIARSPKHKDSFNAIKTLLTMHGKLDPSVKVTLTRSELNTALDEVIAQLAEAKQAAVSTLGAAAEDTVN